MSLANLKEELILLNETIYFDSNQFLREKSSNPSKIKQVIDEAEALLKRLKSTDSIAKDDEHFIYGTLGNLYRISGEPKIAVTYLALNLKHAIEEGNHTREIISLIRLGEALKYENKHADALEKFNMALTLSTETESQSYTDFALQHKGKCLLELNNVEDALLCFREALEIRKVKGIRSLIDSTEVALEFALMLLHQKDLNSKKKRDMQLIIRAAEPNDAKQLVNLIEQVESSGFMLFEPGERKISDEKMKNRIDSVRKERSSTILIAENKGVIVGYLFAVGGNPTRTKHSVYIAVGVGENQRGIGIGAILFEALEEWASQQSIHRLELTVMTHNVAGIALYKKMGFEIEGTKRDSLLIDGKYVDEYYMSKLL